VLAWTCGGLIVVLILSVGGGTLTVRHRYRKVLRHIAFQIQTVIDLEARALTDNDRDLYLAQQDEAALDWVQRQAAHIWPSAPRSGSGMVGRAALESKSARSDRRLARLRAEVQRVEMRGSVAWVEVTTGQGAVRQARFYRKTPWGWKHTAPRTAFWQEALELDYGRVIVRAHERDQPHA
jgi:hypothetical protein